jgi:hypothetical protein
VTTTRYTTVIEIDYLVLEKNISKKKKSVYFSLSLLFLLEKVVALLIKKCEFPSPKDGF